ncbi:hypothetical protein [Streptomyces sp. NPDC001292]|uniref:hypothetical protein n=1 Tax=Streptomyces sp. NPDC001292 TaxID=3364558 RepID=UPI00367D1985
MEFRPLDGNFVVAADVTDVALRRRLYGSLVGTLAEAMRRGSCLETEEAAGGEVLHKELFTAIRDREVDKAVDTALGLVDASVWEVETVSEDGRQQQDS